jgi:hypothetical protein
MKNCPVNDYKINEGGGGNKPFWLEFRTIYILPGVGWMIQNLP